MKTWVITGGAASGKSSFCKMLQSLQPEKIAFYSSDETVHALFEESSVKKELVQLFGEMVVNATSGKVDRVALRQRVFNHAEDRKVLENLLHPLAFERLTELRERLSGDGKTQLLIAEIPLFYETGREFPADLVILVAVSPAVQRQRMMEKRGLTSVDVERILDAQLPLASKLELAGRVVWNEGDTDLLLRQAQLILHQVNSPTCTLNPLEPRP
ncbi:dephospho-CoA kinase [Phragmitibacter flavus]|uniref:Dephospho-CoA kinase n=1 Tax=Phragmitibacter flavus TaxID=2576071 RepID=A0A5R8KH53_9BACT|nr:dephospho-CoA kinase [Phragmitibacter flavus]TLD71570.1 dephospho-CoA kinase [Phragmitibacter flavus]